MNLDQLKYYYRQFFKVVTGGPVSGPAGKTRSAGILSALDKLTEATYVAPLLAGELDDDKADYADLAVRPLLIKVVNALGQSSSTPATATPTGFTATPSTNSVVLAWDGPTSATYVLQRAADAGFTSGLVTIYTGTNKTTTNSSGLTAGATYYYRLKAQVAGAPDSAYATAQAVLPSLRSVLNVVGGGDSIMEGVGSSAHLATQNDPQPDRSESWLLQMRDLDEEAGAAQAGDRWVNKGVGGTDTVYFNANAVDQIDSEYVSGKRNILFTYGPTNNFFKATPDSPEVALAGMETWVKGRIAAGFEVFINTCIANNQPWNSQIAPYNELLRANWQAWGCAGCIDFYSIAELATPTAGYLSDGIHGTTLAYHAMAELAYGVLSDYLALHPNPGAAPATITFGALAGKTVGDAPFALTATSTNSVTPITFASSNPAAVSVAVANGAWTATVVGAGTANITASQAAGAGYLAAADVVRSLTVAASSAPGALVQEAMAFNTTNNLLATASTNNVLFAASGVGYNTARIMGTRGIGADSTSPVRGGAQLRVLDDYHSDFIVDLTATPSNLDYVAVQYGIQFAGGHFVRAFGAASGFNPALAEGSEYIDVDTAGGANTIDIAVDIENRTTGPFPGEWTVWKKNGVMFHECARANYHTQTMTLNPAQTLTPVVRGGSISSQVKGLFVSGTNLVTL